VYTIEFFIATRKNP
jgi:hypothetical protein